MSEKKQQISDVHKALQNARTVVQNFKAGTKVKLVDYKKAKKIIPALLQTISMYSRVQNLTQKSQNNEVVTKTVKK